MTQVSLEEFLRELERYTAEAEQDQDELLNTNVGLTRPSISLEKIALSAARGARRLQGSGDKETIYRPPAARPAAAPRPPEHPRPRRRKFCRQCGEQLKPGKRFCTRCGTPIG